MKIAIIGAGIAGLAAAHVLHQHADVTVFEKSKGVGGRAATRWHDLPSGERVFIDHGAQYFKDESPALHELVSHVIPSDDLVEPSREVWTFDGDGNIQEGDPAHNRGAKLSYRNGLATLGRLIVQTATLDVKLQTRVGKLTHEQERISLADADGSSLGRFEHVLCTVPAPQAADLMLASDLPDAAAGVIIRGLSRAAYRRCLTIILGTNGAVKPRPYYALLNTDRQHPIAWLAFEHEKPGHVPSANGVIIAQMGPRYSLDSWDAEPEQVIGDVASRVTDLLGEDFSKPAWTEYQKWRYAQPDQIVPESTLNNQITGLWFAGDYTRGGRIHLAAQSGSDVAHDLLKTIPR